MTQSHAPLTNSAKLGWIALSLCMIGVVLTYTLWHRLVLVPMLVSFFGPILLLVSLALALQALFGRRGESVTRAAGRALKSAGLILGSLGLVTMALPGPDAIGMILGLFFAIPVSVALFVAGVLLFRYSPNNEPSGRF